MRDEYDFSNGRPNPYAGRLSEPITLSIDTDIIDYFKAESERTGMPYQNIINLYLGQCVLEQKHLRFE